MLNKWDARFIDLAQHVAQWSKDLSTKTGAVIVRPDKTVASVGFNGFARGCDDNDSLYADRDTKMARVIHCEMNAVLSAREPLQGCTLYTWPFMSCDRCAVHMIQAGIIRTVAPKMPSDKAERWAAMNTARDCFAQAGVICEEI